MKTASKDKLTFDSGGWLKVEYPTEHGPDAVHTRLTPAQAKTLAQRLTAWAEAAK